MNSASWDTARCYFRNLVHTTYREARHIGTKEDKRAKCFVSQQYLAAARLCQSNRENLKSGEPPGCTDTTSTDDIIEHYRSLTGLALEHLVSLFRQEPWNYNYGGNKWAVIAEHTIRLKTAIDEQDLRKTRAIAKAVRHLEHNSGPLVPDAATWHNCCWVQEKWPLLCDSDE